MKKVKRVARIENRAGAGRDGEQKDQATARPELTAGSLCVHKSDCPVLSARWLANTFILLVFSAIKSNALCIIMSRALSRFQVPSTSQAAGVNLQTIVNTAAGSSSSTNILDLCIVPFP